jgi:hypothetical protein
MWCSSRIRSSRYDDGWVMIALMREAVSLSETSVAFYKTTRFNVNEDSQACV